MILGYFAFFDSTLRMASKFSLLRAILLDLSPSFWMASVLVVTQWPLLVILWHHGEKLLLKNGFGMVK